MTAEPFWKAKSLAEMTDAEWKACATAAVSVVLNKLEDWDTGEIAWTSIGCTLLDGTSCRCKDYENRQATVPDCIRLTPEMVESLTWLPPTCAYRLVRDGEDLYWWHYLVSGDRETVHAARHLHPRAHHLRGRGRCGRFRGLRGDLAAGGGEGK